MSTRTPEQIAAITTLDRNVIVVAGAGSGKTFVLVERFLHLLDVHPEWALNAIVAITFTTKAAAEMRARVRRELEARAQNALDDETRARWQRLWASMEGSRIGTIHALCASILRANAAEAGIDPQFTVLEEDDAAVLLERAADQVMRDLISEDDSAALLFGEYPASAIRQALIEHAHASRTLPDLLPDYVAYWVALWSENARGLLVHFLEDAEFWDHAHWAPDGGFPQGDDLLLDVWSACYALLDALRQPADPQTQVGYLKQLVKAINLKGGKPSLWGGTDGVKESRAHLGAMREYAEALAKVIGDPPGEDSQRAAALIPLWHRAITRMRAAYADAKDRLSAVDFDDLERKTRDLLERFPHVGERYRGGEFRHVMVDEFQDTNADQWAIITALADVNQPGSLFLVGDPKQSIYAFRGADVSVFERVRAAFKATPAGLEILMGQSFRTHTTLVNGFNDLFGQILTRDERSAVREYQVTFDPMRAERTPPETRCAVEIALHDKGLLKEADEGEETDARLWEADAVARRIHEIVNVEQWMIFDRDAKTHRLIRYGDIAILFQGMTHVTAYEEALKTHGVDYVTISGRGYYDRQEVWDVLNLLRVLHNPADDLALASVLRSPMFALSDDALLMLRLILSDDASPVPLITALEHAAHEPGFVPDDEQPLVIFAAQCLNDLRRWVGRVTMAELLQRALDSTAYLAILTGLPDGARRRGNVEKLLTKAAASGAIGLGVFTRALTDLSERETREGEVTLDVENAVRLMTIHKSKGLEFPLVVLVDLSYNFASAGSRTAPLIVDPVVGIACHLHESAIRDDKNNRQPPYAYALARRLNGERGEAERRRLLYVAATRAQDYLLLSGSFKVSSKQEITCGGVMTWLYDALKLADHGIDTEGDLPYAWGTARLRLPLLTIESGLSDDRVGDQPSADADPVQPPLTARIPRQIAAAARSLSATQIADLGAAHLAASDVQRAVYALRWRRSMVFEAPSHIETITSKRHFGRRIGEIVHQALCVSDPNADDMALKTLTRSLAWERGITAPGELAAAVEDALSLLKRVRRSEIFQWIAEAREVYRELPFAFRAGDRQIHGKLDLLLHMPDGEWRIVDYKTDTHPKDEQTRAAMERHASRYALQVGAYAVAVSRLIGVVPRTFIHYIRYNQRVEITEAEWRDAFSRLEGFIGGLFEDEP